MARYLGLYGSGVKIKEYLGGGTDGDVWKTDHDTAVKIFHADRGYYNERDTYFRLADFGITDQIDGFWIPKMHASEHSLRAIEMDMMHNPPYIIDFAKVRLNSSPEFSEDVLRQLEQ